MEDYINKNQKEFIRDSIHHKNNSPCLSSYLNDEQEKKYVNLLHHLPDKTILEVDELDIDSKWIRIFFFLNEGTIYQVDTNFEVNKITSIRRVTYLGC
jgi:hypothetical protein